MQKNENDNPENNVLVEFKNVKKSYFDGKLVVLEDFSFKFLEGETHVICGRSGSGKSTLIRCINRLETIDSGEILFQGVPVNPKNARSIRKRISMVFQEFNLFPHMTVLQNVIFAPTHALGIPKHEAIETGREYLKKVGVLDKIDAYPYQLSGGQKQRVAIARALNRQPELILFDEPTSALDPEMVGEVVEVMKGLAEEGRSMIVVTHEMGFAYSAADRISFLEDGQFLVTDNPSNFFTKVKEESVQRFIKQVEYK